MKFKPLVRIFTIVALLSACRSILTQSQDSSGLVYSRQARVQALGKKPTPAKLTLSQTHTKPTEFWTGHVQFDGLGKNLSYRLCRSDDLCVAGTSPYIEEAIHDFVTPAETIDSAACYSLDRLKEVVPLQRKIATGASSFALSLSRSGETVLCWLAEQDKYWSWMMSVDLQASTGTIRAAPIVHDKPES